MTLTLFLLVATVTCDIVGQVFFKLGVGHDDGVAEAGAKPVRGGIAPFLRNLVGSPWIVAGVLVYAVEFVVWFAALTRMPLSEAFPFNALSYCGVVLASRYLLREKVSPRRWLGTLIIALGVTLIFLA
jgi:drug/metabolite transporter (DMT)-like permease